MQIVRVNYTFHYHKIGDTGGYRFSRKTLLYGKKLFVHYRIEGTQSGEVWCIIGGEVFKRIRNPYTFWW